MQRVNKPVGFVLSEHFSSRHHLFVTFFSTSKFLEKYKERDGLQSLHIRMMVIVDKTGVSVIQP